MYQEEERTRIILLGAAKSTREMIPNGDFMIWSLLQNETWLGNADLWFEIHNLGTSPAIRDIIEKKVKASAAVMTADGVNGSVVYPLEEVIKKTGTTYFTSSFDYMAAYALLYHLEVADIDEIQIIGFNFQGGEEYERQLPGASYWIGRLEGEGIKVSVQENSAVKKAYKMYAFGDHSEIALLNEKKLMIEIEKNKLQSKIDELKINMLREQKQLEEMMQQMYRVQGAEAIINDTRELMLRGGA